MSIHEVVFTTFSGLYLNLLNDQNKKTSTKHGVFNMLKNMPNALAMASQIQAKRGNSKCVHIFCDF